MRKLIYSLSILALIPVTALAVSGPTVGKAEGPNLVSNTDGEVATPSLIFGCNDEDLGHFDLCVDTAIGIERATLDLYLKTKIGSQYRSQYPKILQRSFVSVFWNSDNYADRTVTLHSETGTSVISVPQGETTKIYTTSSDGGKTWSPVVAEQVVNP